VPNTLKNGRQPVLKTGPSPFSRPFFPLTRTADETGWVPFSKRAAARFGTRLEIWGAPVLRAVFSHWPERPTKRAGSRFPNGQRAVLVPVLEIGVRPFSRPFFPLARTAYNTGWLPFPKRAEGRSGTRLGNWGNPRFQGRFSVICQTLSETGGNPF
jgi:hypothetical protein